MGTHFLLPILTNAARPTHSFNNASKGYAATVASSQLEQREQQPSHIPYRLKFCAVATATVAAVAAAAGCCGREGKNPRAASRRQKKRQGTATKTKTPKNAERANKNKKKCAGSTTNKKWSTFNNS